MIGKSPDSESASILWKIIGGNPLPTKESYPFCVRYNETAFADAILQLLGEPARALEMGIRGRRYVKQLRDYARTADLVENKCYEILASGDKRGNSLA